MSTDEVMETDEETRRGNLLDDMPPIHCEGSVEGGVGASCNDSGDMTFCMGNYITDFMKVTLILLPSKSKFRDMLATDVQSTCKPYAN